MYKKRNFGECVTRDTRLEAYEGISDSRKIRYEQILECLQNRPMTAKQVAVMMMEKGYIPTSERNFTAPRLTELSYDGFIEPIGKVTCEYTGRKVAVYAIREVA